MNCRAILMAITMVVGAMTLSVSAAAQEGKLSIYGTILPYVENFRTVNPTPEGLSPETGGATQVTADDYSGEDIPERFRMTSGNSNLGFRGELKLGHHFSAFFQIENALGPDGDPFILASAWASRNSAVGINSTFGALFFGNWETPYMFPTLFLGAHRGLNPFDNAITGNPGFNVPSVATRNGRGSSRHDAAFIRRQGNSIQYWTPKLWGFSARGAVSVNEGRTREEFDPSINPVLWSGLLSYAFETLHLDYSYERHIDYFGMDWVGGSPGGTITNPKSMDDAHEFIAWYEFPPTRTRASVIGERLTYQTEDQVVGAPNGYQREAIHAALQQRLGDHMIWGSFGYAGEGRCTVVGGGPCTTNGLEGLQWSLGYTYSPASTIDIYAGFASMSNGRSGSYGLFPPVSTVAPGATTYSVGIGIMYLFDFTVSVGGETSAFLPQPFPVLRSNKDAQQ